MPDTQSRFATMPPKQKITAVIFLLIGVFIIYEAIGIFRSGGKGPPPPIQPKTPPIMTNMGPTPASPVAKAVAPNKQLPSPPSPVAHASPVVSKPAVTETLPPPPPSVLQQQQPESNYLKALNELQVLKLKREMAETDQAIMAAKLATVTAEKNIADLLGGVKSIPSAPSANHAIATPANLAPPPELMPLAAARYVVQSITQQQDQWHAVLKYKDAYYDVTVGDILPPDGSAVTAIDQKGVTLTQGGVEQRVPWAATDTMSIPSPPSPMPGPVQSNLPQQPMQMMPAP